MKFALMFSSLGLMAAAKDDSPPASASAKPTAKKVKVKVLINSLGEGDNTYVKDETFETTAERAEALGTCVEVLT